MLPSRIPVVNDTVELEPDPYPEEKPRKHTGSTEVDWSGHSYEENGRQYQGYMPGGMQRAGHFILTLLIMN